VDAAPGASGASAAAAPAGGSAIVPSGRTTMVFTLRGPPSGMESSAEETATGSATPHGVVVGEWGDGDRLGAADGLRRRRGEIGGRDRGGHAAGIGRRR